MVISQLIPLPALSDNYIWLLSRGHDAIVVDPGEAQGVDEYITRHGLALRAILLTHHHGDHVNGATALHERTGAPIYGPAHERLPICHHRLVEGDTVQFPGFDVSFDVLDVPGHTAGHIAYFGQPPGMAPVLFCGDTLFAAGCGRLFEGTPSQMLASLGKFAALPGTTLICCAHEYTVSNLRWALSVEPDNTVLQERWEAANRLREKGLPTLPSTLQIELDSNPFLRTGIPAVKDSVVRHVNRDLPSEVDVFANLREWKNNF